MTAPLSHLRDEDARETRDRQPLVLVAAALVAVVVVALVLVFGVARPPQLASIADDPAITPPARLATHGWEDGDHCVTVVELDGTTRRPWCSQDSAELVGWTERGVVLRTYGRSAELELTIDPDDGEVVASEHGRTDHLGRDRGDAVTSARPAGDDVLEVRTAEGTVLWRVEAPDSYQVSYGWRSPDGRTVALIDSADRLLLVPADGSRQPRVWAEDVPNRYEVAWEGSGRG